MKKADTLHRLFTKDSLKVHYTDNLEEIKITIYDDLLHIIAVGNIDNNYGIDLKKFEVFDKGSQTWSESEPTQMDLNFISYNLEQAVNKVYADMEDEEQRAQAQQDLEDDFYKNGHDGALYGKFY